MSRHVVISLRGRIASLVTAALLTPAVGVSSVAAATPTDLFISEYVDGSGWNEVIEIYNGTGGPINLTTGNYTIQVFADGSSTPQTTALSGTIADGDVFVITHPGAVLPDIPDQTTTTMLFNGNDAVALRIGVSGPIVDLIGQIGENPGQSGWGSGELITNDRTLVRKPTVTSGRTASGPFDPSVEWNVFPFNTLDHLGSHVIDTSGGGGGSDSGAVDATISMTDSAVCIELSTASVDFGDGEFGQEDVAGSPDIEVTNCGLSSITLFAQGTDASATDAMWNLVNNTATCADTLGTDNYHLRLRDGQTPDLDWNLGTTPAQLEDLDGGSIGIFEPLIDTACPGSSGAGLEMGLQIVFTATEPS